MAAVRGAHEHQTKGSFDDLLMLVIRVRIDQSLLDENASEAVTDKYEWVCFVLPDQ